MNPFSLEGKTILVTGASSGIGRGIAIECSKMGAKLVLNGRNAERLQETLDMMDGDGHQIIPADISKQEGIDRLISELPLLDGCVLCAGIPQVCPVKYFKRADIEDIFSVNAFAPMMMKQRSGSIVNISSIVGLNGNAGQCNYAASKAGIIGFTRSIAKELGSRGIRCNAVAPGFIETPMTQQLSEEVRKEWMKQIPLHRGGLDTDVAHVSLFLASDLAGYVTGQVISCDGGLAIN